MVFGGATDGGFDDAARSRARVVVGLPGPLHPGDCRRVRWRFEYRSMIRDSRAEVLAHTRRPCSRAPRRRRLPQTRMAVGVRVVWAQAIGREVGRRLDALFVAQPDCRATFILCGGKAPDLRDVRHRHCPEGHKHQQSKRRALH